MYVCTCMSAVGVVISGRSQQNAQWISSVPLTQGVKCSTGSSL
jgi:hypothetical protein